MACWPPTRPFQAVLQPIRYLLDRSLCFRPERELAGSDFHRRINRALQGTHNNRCENAIRPFVIGRKAWLFSDTPAGANASALIYSLVETAKANGLDPYAWMRLLMREVPTARSVDDYEALLPWNLHPDRLAIPFHG